MTDIVERLRFLASGQDDPQSVALANAADEIERLREALQKISEWDLTGTALAALGEKE